MTYSTSGRRALTICFFTAARCYWLSVFPCILHEINRWRTRAEAIPDPRLRRLALEAQRTKRGNVEGSAALAAFVPAELRAQVVRAQVAFQSIYDYVDTLAEQPCTDPIGNAHQLHQALLVAIDADAEHGDYYAQQPHHTEDAGYLQEIVDTCRSSLNDLPSHAATRTQIRRSAERIVGYQSLNLTESQGGHQQLKQWAKQLTPPETELRWWETAASAGSSLGLFALIAAAAQPALTTREATAIEMAYWPWIGALHSLLDSLVDEPEDAHANQRSLLSYYITSDETVSRFRVLTNEARRSVDTLPNAHQHTLILAAMVSHYLTAPHASTSTASQASRAIRGALGRITVPTMRILAARRIASRLFGSVRSTV
jgi:tetraprenyl-beta-curcumene synthase